MSARLVIKFVQIFFVNFLMRLDRHSAVSPNLETKCTDSADDRHHCAKKEPNRDGHVLSRFAVFRAVTKRTRARLLDHKQDRSAYAESYGAASKRQDRQSAPAPH